MTYMCVHLHAPQKPQTDAPLPDTCVWMLMFMLDCFRVYNMCHVFYGYHTFITMQIAYLLSLQMKGWLLSIKRAEGKLAEDDRWAN